MFLEEKKDNLWHQGWQCLPSPQSGTLNILQIPPCRTPNSWDTFNQYINMKLLGYLTLGEIRSSMTLRMTMSSMSPIRNLQCPPSIPMKDHPFLTQLREGNIPSYLSKTESDLPSHSNSLSSLSPVPPFPLYLPPSLSSLPSLPTSLSTLPTLPICLPCFFLPQGIYSESFVLYLH